MTSETRDRARERYEARCGDCGVTDVAIGSTLTIDHHRPRSRGGRDDDENMVYACPRCNEHKGSYWHEEHPPHVPLLHPGRHDLALHLRECTDGRLVGLTAERAVDEQTRSVSYALGAPSGATPAARARPDRRSSSEAGLTVLKRVVTCRRASRCSCRCREASTSPRRIARTRSAVLGRCRCRPEGGARAGRLRSCR
jgi:hypothetical protein